MTGTMGGGNGGDGVSPSGTRVTATMTTAVSISAPQSKWHDHAREVAFFRDLLQSRDSLGVPFKRE